MLNGLLIVAGVNLSLSMVLSAGMRRTWTTQQRLLAGVPALWALLMLGAYVALRITEPSSPIGVGPDGHRIILRHGSLDWLLWESRVNAVSALTFWLTVATFLGVLVFVLARRLKMRRTWPSVINWDN